jgi:7-carboxy-7-deazaguanine synthase
MHGKNEVASRMHDEKGNLLVNEIFYTIQGEGPDAGCPAVFVRLAKCNLRCYFCDTEFDIGKPMTMPDVCSVIQKLTADNNCRLVVITGGEPLLQNIVPLTVMLNKNGIGVSVETAGTVYYPELWSVFGANTKNQIVCSPKTPQIAKGLSPIVAAWKYIIKKGETDPNDGLPVMSTQIEGERSRIYRGDPSAPIYVQPMDENDPIAPEENVLWARDIAMRHGYRLSLQIHKLIGVP